MMYFKKGVTKIFLWPLFENLKNHLVSDFTLIFVTKLHIIIIITYLL